MRITFLGTGDSMGTPRVYCDCSICMEARTTGVNRRFRSSLWIEEEGQRPLLLDCGPDWLAQMEGNGTKKVSQALITHAHFDHIGGMTEWADACRWTNEKGVAYAPREVLNEIRQRFPWIERHIEMAENDNGMTYGKWRITPWRVNHGKNGYSYAYRFSNEENGVNWVYCSDAINLTERQKAPLADLALLVLGTSFAEEPYPMDTRSVYDMREGLLLSEEWNPQSVVFTHLSHDIDVTHDYRLPENVKLARTGLSMNF
ncbi:MBL fold metallo-hydrolase [Cohnella lupini]|uniref:Phosphoribosyl 1,2-cyclic phosphate phosphodiesterase n=1 Tax=Cohnella lupini TaxID=1294267 RepID=A0A3D9IF23_9BACL|nr:MBL fold metallo-hydrolase [Cohnella lupini]RED60285.1 phosphoribosyl 1,2-cyclic phosphate phosphodiesterase [Cohnella lupini]